MKNKGNVIPWKFSKIIFKGLLGTNANEPGDIMEAYRDDCNRLIILNTRTGKTYQGFLSHLRIKEMAEILQIVTQ